MSMTFAVRETVWALRRSVRPSHYIVTGRVAFIEPPTQEPLRYVQIINDRMSCWVRYSDVLPTRLAPTVDAALSAYRLLWGIEVVPHWEGAYLQAPPPLAVE